MKKLFVLLFILILSSCSIEFKPKEETFTFDLEVEKIENLKSDFIMGMDISSVIALEASGVKYYDFDGSEKDIFEILSKYGINYIRVRIWNDPYNSDNKGYGGGNNDLETAIKIGLRATKYKMKLLVDFHYSDFWADPEKQKAPKAWASYTVSQKETAVYEYTKDALTQMKNKGIDVGMVQMGNEINNGLAGETDWSNKVKLLKQSSIAIKEVYPNALRAVHFTNPEKSGLESWFAEQLNKYEVEYDVFGTSYYPFWHGTLENLSNVLTTIATTYNKKVMVLETSYPYTSEDTDFASNTISASSTNIDKPYEYSVLGQATSVRNVIDTVNKISAGIGVCYWEGAWITVGGATWQENNAIWEEHGSGWASSYCKDYDSEAFKYHGGSGVDNQAFFDTEGKPLESLKLFKYLQK